MSECLQIPSRIVRLLRVVTPDVPFGEMMTGRIDDGGIVIARMWRGWVSTERASAYVDYINETGIKEYLETPGNHGAQMWTRDLGDGRTEVLTLSWWESLDAVRGFAGDDIETAVYYPEDDEYLVDRELTVTHYEVPAALAPPSPPPVPLS